VLFWRNTAGEELVSILTALRPFASGLPGWADLEHLFTENVLKPLAAFLREENTSDGYAQGLKRLRTYHAGALYTRELFAELGIPYLGNGDDPRTCRKVADLIDFYLIPPQPRWLPDGYDDEDVSANRAEIPGLLELLDVKRRVQPSSHFIALHLSAELSLETLGEHGWEVPLCPPEVAARPVVDEEEQRLMDYFAGRQGGDLHDLDDQSTQPAAQAEATAGRLEPLQIRIWRAVPAKPPRRSGISFVRGEKFEERDLSGDEEGMIKTSTLRDYQRKHHAEVIALTQVAEIIESMQRRFQAHTAGSSRPPTAPARHRVVGFVELFVPHFPCCSCTGAAVQFQARYRDVALRLGHDDWRHWCHRLEQRWDPEDKRHHQLSVNARQLRELDTDVSNRIPEAYRAALRGTLGSQNLDNHCPGGRGVTPASVGSCAVVQAPTDASRFRADAGVAGVLPAASPVSGLARVTPAAPVVEPDFQPGVVLAKVVAPSAGQQTVRQSFY